MRAWVTVFLVVGIHLKIFRSMWRVRKHADETALICGFMDFFSRMMLQFLALSAGVGGRPSSFGHQELSQRVVVLLRLSAPFCQS